MSAPSVNAALSRFASGRATHLAGVHPRDAVRANTRTVFDALHRRLGPEVLAKALDPAAQVESPRANEADGRWLQHTSCMGVNLRTTGGLLGAVKYVLTLPPHVNAVHLLPVFEPGVVGSLYGMASWRINAEFFDAGWARLVPAMRHVNDQLRAFVDLCHALGKTVGLDVIPHTDRFSEIALCQPWLFEWVQRDDVRILQQRADLHRVVEQVIVLWARGRTDARLATAFFARPEPEIARELFGDGDFSARNARRDELIQFLYERGYEPLPATMAPPYRGLELDPSQQAVTVDARGRRWRDYRFTEPQAMSRVFGPLTRYKLYERLDDNAAWAIDHDKARLPVWDYVARHYHAVVAQFGFDFMRGDMSHVQTRPGGVPPGEVEPYDLLRYVKRACAKTYPHFGYFAESFLTADDYMTYGSEAAHLDKSEADVALGNLQNYAPAHAAFGDLLARYTDLRQNHRFAPCFTLFTADKDDPRFDANFDEGSVARYFFAACCTAMPAYSSLGFRVRDRHVEPWPNEYYTKLYVFRYDEGPKATRGPYRWGDNAALFAQLTMIDQLREQHGVGFDGDGFAWLQAPGKQASTVLAWRQGRFVGAINWGPKPRTYAAPGAGAKTLYSYQARAVGNTFELAAGGVLALLV